MHGVICAPCIFCAILVWMCDFSMDVQCAVCGGGGYVPFIHAVYYTSQLPLANECLFCYYWYSKKQQSAIPSQNVERLRPVESNIRAEYQRRHENTEVTALSSK